MLRLISFILLVPSLCLAQTIDLSKPMQIARMNPYVAGAGVGAACSYSTQQSMTTINNDQVFGHSSVNLCLATRFTTSGAYTLCRLTFRLFKQGTPTGRNITAYVYADSSGPTGSALATSTTTLAATSITETAYTGGSYDFNFTGLSLNATTNYWAAMCISGAADTTNYVRTTKNGSAGSGVWGSSDGGATWSFINSNTDFYLITTN